MELTFPSIIKRLGTEQGAYKFLEELRWGDKVVCPHCGSLGEHRYLEPRNGKSRETSRGKQSERRVWKCRDCSKQFSVLTGTVMHGSHIPVSTWILVFYEMCASKNGVASREIERKYKLSPKSAWFLTQRIREAMKRDPLVGLLSGTILVDEAYIGGKPRNKHRNQFTYGDEGQRFPKKDLVPVVSLIHKETGEVRSQVVPRVTGDNLREIFNRNVDVRSSVLHTDGATLYRRFRGGSFLDHEWVDHSMGEYVRGNVTTNHVEGYFGQLKRSINGTHHHVSEEHLPRYLAEFDFRYNTCDETDSARMQRLMGRVGGRRLTYRPITGDVA